MKSLRNQCLPCSRQTANISGCPIHFTHLQGNHGSKSTTAQAKTSRLFAKQQLYRFQNQLNAFKTIYPKPPKAQVTKVPRQQVPAARAVDGISLLPRQLAEDLIQRRKHLVGQLERSPNNSKNQQKQWNDINRTKEEGKKGLKKPTTSLPSDKAMARLPDITNIPPNKRYITNLYHRFHYLYHTIAS